MPPARARSRRHLRRHRLLVQEGGPVLVALGHHDDARVGHLGVDEAAEPAHALGVLDRLLPFAPVGGDVADRKSTRLNSSHLVISYAVFCLTKIRFSHVSWTYL